MDSKQTADGMADALAVHKHKRDSGPEFCLRRITREWIYGGVNHPVYLRGQNTPLF